MDLNIYVNGGQLFTSPKKEIHVSMTYGMVLLLE